MEAFRATTLVGSRYLALLTMLCVCLCGLSCAAGRSGSMDASTREARAIQQRLDELDGYVEGKQLQEAMQVISMDYHDGQGRDRVALEKYLSDMFARYETIAITRGLYFDLLFDESGYNRARVVEKFVLSAKPFDQASHNLRVDGFIDVRLAKEKGTWKIIEWGEFTPAGVPRSAVPAAQSRDAVVPE